MAPKMRYSKLETSEEDGADYRLLDEELHDLPRGRYNSKSLKYAAWMLHVVIATINLVIVLYVVTMEKGQEGLGSCVNEFYSYSPINDAITKEEYTDYWFKGSLWYDSPYKGPPTPQVNKAWEKLMEYGAISVTAEDIERIGHNLTAVQWPPEVGGGYLAVAMGSRHIHCLHYVWQDHHASYFPETKANMEKAPDMYERHYEHCIDYLRQGIMCNFDPGIIPYHWVNQHNQPTPDGNTFHKCINWNRLQGWLKDRAVDKPEGFEWRQPPDAVPLPHNP